MTITEHAYRVHHHLRAMGATSLRRSHVYELLAAAVGYRSHAALRYDAIWCEVAFSSTDIALDTDALSRRARALGIPVDEAIQVDRELPRFLRGSGFAPVRFSELIAAVDGDDESDDWRGWVSSMLVATLGRSMELSAPYQGALPEALEHAARRGVPAAHFAIAALLESEAARFGDDEERVQRTVRQEGKWTSAFVSFAEIALDPMRVEQKFRHHLLAAARSGDVRALMETAERYGDPGILHLSPSDDMYPMDMASLAAEHGDEEKARYWLAVGASQGDIDAMSHLVTDHVESLEQAWVWMHLSRLLGHDLSKDRHIAIDEDGTPYDDDAGGPAYVGGEDGIQLEPLSPSDDKLVREAAAQLFARIEADSDYGLLN